MNFNQPFVNCGVCHIGNNGNFKFFLTSCAHILCSNHLNIDTSQLDYIKNLDQVKIKCPVCSTSGISILEINDDLPNDLKGYFKPFPSQLETFFANSQFQYVGMVEKLEFKDEIINKLNFKISKLKELLLQAKDEINLMNSIRSENESLRKTNSQLKQQIRSIAAGRSSNGHSNSHKRPVTIDLTNLSDSANDSNQQLRLKQLDSQEDYNRSKRQRTGSGDYKSFVAKIQRFSSLKKLPDSESQSQSRSLASPSRSAIESKRISDQFQSFKQQKQAITSFAFQAESTTANASTTNSKVSNFRQQHQGSISHLKIPSQQQPQSHSQNRQVPPSPLSLTSSSGATRGSVSNYNHNNKSSSISSDASRNSSSRMIITPTSKSMGFTATTKSIRGGGGAATGEPKLSTRSPSTGIIMSSSNNSLAGGRPAGFRSISLRPPQATNRLGAGGGLSGSRRLISSSSINDGASMRGANTKGVNNGNGKFNSPYYGGR